jgi:hypothetical protein
MSPCYNCECPSQPAQQCACLLWWCQACLEQEIDCWITLHETALFPSLSFQEQNLSHSNKMYCDLLDCLLAFVAVLFVSNKRFVRNRVNEYRLVKYEGVPLIVNPF